MVNCSRRFSRIILSCKLLFMQRSWNHIIKRESRTPRNQRLSVYRFKFPRSRFHTISPVRLTILEHPRLFRLIATLSPPLSILRQARNHKEHAWPALFASVFTTPIVAFEFHKKPQTVKTKRSVISAWKSI